MSKVTVWSVAALVIVAASSCGAPGPSPRTGNVAGQMVIVYTVPGSDPTKAGNAYERLIDPNTMQSIGVDSPIGTAFEVWPVGTHTSAQPVTWVVAYDDGRGTVSGTALTATGLVSAWQSPSGHSVPWLTAIRSDGTVAYTDLNSVVTVDVSGATRNYSVAAPTLLPGQVATVDGSPTRNQPSPSDVGLGGMVFGPDGHLIVAEGNTINGAVIDLFTNRRLDLPGYGSVMGVCLGSDGRLYVVARNPSRSLNPYVLITLQYSPFSIAGVTPTTFVPDSSVGRPTVTASGTNIYLYVPFGASRPGQLPNGRLFKLSITDQAISEPSPPAATGWRMQADSDGKLSLFPGGVNQNIITTYDPTTNAFAQTSVQLPTVGSHIDAVFM